MMWVLVSKMKGLDVLREVTRGRPEQGTLVIVKSNHDQTVTHICVALSSVSCMTVQLVKISPEQDAHMANRN